MRFGWQASVLGMLDGLEGCRSFCSILATSDFTPKLDPLLPLIWFLILSLRLLKLGFDWTGDGCVRQPFIEKTVCTKHDALDKMSLAWDSATSGRLRNSAGMASSTVTPGAAKVAVTAAEAEVEDDWPFIGHSLRQCPFFPHSLQLDSMILCCRDFRFPQGARPFDLPRPLAFPLEMGQNPLYRYFSLSFLRASMYVLYAAARSSSPCTNSLAAVSKSAMNTASSSPSAMRASSRSSSVQSS